MIILLNGSINSGKSTVAKLLAAKLKETAVVEIDELRQFIDWMSLKESIPINLANAIAVTKVFLGKDLNVIIPYPLSLDNYQYLRDSLQAYTNKFYTFTLSPTLEIAQSNRGKRKLDDEEMSRIKYHYDAGINNPKFGITLDNSDESPEETADRIISLLK